MVRSRYQDEEVSTFEDLTILRFPVSGPTFFVYLLLGSLFSFLVVFTGSFYESGLPIFMLPIWVVALCGIVKYGFVILEFTARGRQQVPKFSGEMLLANFDAGSLFKELSVQFILISPVLAVSDVWLQVALILVVLLILPAVYYYVGVENNFFGALNPVKLSQFIRHSGFGAVTAKLAAIEMSLATLLFVGARDLTTIPAPYLFLGTCIAVYLILMLFRCIGVLLHCRREELGIETEFSPEQEESERRKQVHLKRSDVIYDLHRLSQRDSLTAAWEMLESALNEDEFESEADYFHSVSQWPNPILMLKMGQGYVERLLERNDAHRAWQIFGYCHDRSEGNFHLANGTTVIDLCEKAHRLNHYKLAVEQLGQFESDFPEHPRRKEALYLAVKICSSDLNDFEQARIHLRTIEEKFPDAPQEERYQKFSDLLMT